MGDNNNSWTNYIPLVGAGISAIGNIGSGRKNRRAAREMNQANIDAQLRLNNENREWNERMWNQTNAYNSPAQQMARYKEAGLNPHLIYGSQPQASQPMSASTGAPHSEALPADTTINEIGSSIFQAGQNYIAMRKQQTETDNMEKARQVMDADILQKNASTAESMTRNAKSKFDLQLAQDLRSNVMEQSILNTKNLGLTSQKIEMDIRATEKGMKMTDAQISKIAQDIMVQQKQIDLMQIQGRVQEAELKQKNLDINLKELGLQPSDSPWFRVPVQLFHKFSDYMKSYGRDKFPAEKIRVPKSWK